VQIDTPYYAVLDANIWIAERLLQTSIGSAALFALTSSRALIALPEVVEIEVRAVLADQAEQAVEALRKHTQLLAQLSGQRAMHSLPTAAAIPEGIDRRWTQLEGILKRSSFSFDSSKGGS
jgi:hypothetical protein